MHASYYVALWLIFDLIFFSSRKGSQDLPASEYYKIYQRSKKFSNSERPNEEVIISNQDNDIMEKSEVKVQGGGIAER